MKKTLTSFVLLAALSACASDAPAPVKLQTVAGSVINLDVHAISFADRSLAPSDTPYTSNNFHPTIAEAIREWASERLKAVGTNGDAMVIIKDASLTSQPLPHSDSWFKREQASKYIAHAEVQVEIKGSNRGDYALATAEATRFETLPQNPSVVERQNAYTNVINGLMKDLNQNLETSIQEHMSSFVITAPIINGAVYGTAPPSVKP